MNKVAVKGLAYRRSRTILTAIAIVIGVAMVSGTYVLTDTISSAFDSIFKSSYANTNAVISGKSVVSTAVSGAATVPEPLVSKVKRLDSVGSASGAIFDTSGTSDKAQLLDQDGNLISTGGSPNFGFGFNPDQSDINPMKLTSGHYASTSDQVVIDQGTADNNDFSVGDRIGVSADGPTREFTISGIAKFGDVASLGGATIAVFDVPTAQKLLGKEGEYDIVFLSTAPGHSTSEMISDVRPLLPSSLSVKSAEAQATDQSDDTQAVLNIIRYFLLAFAGIAVLVGAFVTFNTITITIAQRIREFATLRSLGASRRQVLRSVLIESFCIGVMASIVGLFGGLFLAKGLNAVFNALSLSLPTTGLVFQTRTVIVSLLLGVGVTVISSLVPALRATRIPPISAMREGATLPPSRVSKRRGLIVAILSVAAAGLLVYGCFGGLDTGPSLEFIGLGILALFFAVGMGASRLVEPLIEVVGAPSRSLGGEAGRLASENAARNPIRTARTAAALMIGLALVTVVATLGAGLRSSDRDTLNQSVDADYVVTSKNGFDPFTTSAGDAFAKASGVSAAASVRQDQAKAFGGTFPVTGAPPNFEDFFELYLGDAEGASANLGSDGAVVTKSFADDNDLDVGSGFSIKTPSGKSVQLKVAAISDPPDIQKLDPLFGKVVISQATFDDSFPRPQNQFTVVDMNGGATEANTASLEKVAGRFPDAVARTKSAWITERSNGLNQLLNLLYVLLALSVIVSLFGMVNTLVLSVFERTREVGMLRAVGMKRRQVRRMVRQESVITALIGAGLGLPLGIVIAAALTKALSEVGVSFSLPIGSLIAFTLVAVAAGIAAAVIPARRAAKLDILTALHYE